MGALAYRSASADVARQHRPDCGGPSDRGGGSASQRKYEGAGMSELGRLLRFSRPYTPHLLLSVLLMACVGAAQALTALLIGPIFDRVLKPESPDTPVLLVTIPILQHKIFLSDLMPPSIHNVWTMVAVGILSVFFIKGLCDYCANYLISYV